MQITSNNAVTNTLIFVTVVKVFRKRLKIERVLGETTFPTQDAKDEALFIFQTAQLAIMSWKCHILRSANQDQARILDDNTVLIINDWAMKFLPQKYRESQTDWFGKPDISWHVSVVYRRVSGVLQWQGFLHIVQSSIKTVLQWLKSCRMS